MRSSSVLRWFCVSFWVFGALGLHEARAAALTSNKITADGTYTVPTLVGKRYVVAAAGTFGGGSLAFNWNNGITSTAYAGSPCGAATTFTFTAAATTAEFILTGATDPSITVTVALSDWHTDLNGKADKVPGQYQVTDYGARADGVTLYDGTFTSGSTAFTSATASFRQTDIGKKIVLQLSQATRQVLTISSFTNATTIVMSGTASASSSAYTYGITTYGSDNTAAIQAAINAAAPVGGAVKFDAGVYLVTGAPTNPSTNNSIFLIPFAATIADKAQSVTLEGTGSPLFSQFDFGQVPPLSGTVIYCPDKTAAVGEPAIFASVKDSYTGHTWDAVNTTFRLKDLTIRQPSVPTKHGIQADKMGSLFVDSVRLDADIPYWQESNLPLDPQTDGFNSIGIIMPGQRSGYYSRLSKVSVSNCTYGYCLGDISFIDHAFAEFCKFGVTSKFTDVLNGAVTNFTHIGHITTRCRVGFAGPLRITVDQAIIETARTSTAAVPSWMWSEWDIDNYNGAIQGEMNVCAVQNGVGPVLATVRTKPRAAAPTNDELYYRLRVNDLNATNVVGSSYGNNRLGKETHHNLAVRNMFTAPTHALAVVGSGSGTTYGYKVGYTLLDGSIALSPEISISGPGTLNSTNKIQITVPNFVSGAASYTFYRTTGGATQGKLPYTVSKIDEFNKVALDEGFTCDGVVPVSTVGILEVGSGTWDGSTITSPQAFSSTTRPTSAGTGTPAATDLVTRSDVDARAQQTIVYALAADITNNAAGSTNDTGSVTLPVGTWDVTGALACRRSTTGADAQGLLYYISGGTVTGGVAHLAYYNDSPAQEPYYFSTNISINDPVSSPSIVRHQVSFASGGAQTSLSNFSGVIIVTGTPAVLKFRITQNTADGTATLRANRTVVRFSSRN